MLKKIAAVLSILPVLFLGSLTPVSADDLAVEYLGDTKELFSAGDDFFINISDILPGDILKDEAVLKNSADKEIQLFFKTEPLGKENYDLDEDYQLLEKISLKITVASREGDISIYDGRLGAEDFTEFVSLGTYTKGEEAKFKFELTVPGELKNEYDMTKTRVKWIFGVGEKDDTQPDTGDNSSAEVYLTAGGLSSAVFLAAAFRVKAKIKEVHGDEK